MWNTMDLVIDTKWIYYPYKNKLIKDGRVVIEDSTIIFSGTKDESRSVKSGHEYYQFNNGIMIPGLINAHTHIPETLLRGICDNQPLQTWLERIWTYEPHMKPQDAFWGAMLGIAEMVASGTVGFNDQYFYAEQIAQAVQQTGIKANLAPSIFFEGNPESNSMQEAFNYAKKVLKWNGKDKRLWISFGPHAPYTVSKEWFQKIAEEARKQGTKIHTHLNETEYEVKESLKLHSMRPIEWMDKIEVLDTINSAAHCVFTSEAEIDLLNKYEVSILHCPKSNAKIGAGVAQIPSLIENNSNVCLGTDGQASNNKLDMFAEMAFEALIHKAIHKDPTLMSNNTILQMATSNASSLFPQGVYKGTLEVDTPADLVVIDFDSPTTTPIINPVSHLCYAVGREQVVLTMINGSIVYQAGNYLTLDIEKVRKEAQKATDRMTAAVNGT
ncbi:MAG: amidohydrolase [Candidatus Hodarchaeales archaeon]